MAATMTLRQTAKVLPFRKPCDSVEQTDQKNRLPTLSSAEIESFFDHAQRAAETSVKAA